MATQRALFLLANLMCLALLVQNSKARQFTIGAPNGWVPKDATDNSYNQWAEHNRFQIGDSLLFKYTAQEDSVVQVTKENYDRCETGSPIASYKDGNTVVTLSHSGPYYFISGNKNNCQKNEKITVVVLADRSKHGGSPPPAPSGPPPKPEEISPSPAFPPFDNNGGSSMISSFYCYCGAVIIASSVFAL